MDWQWMVAILPWLLFLACPLSMFWMMRGMSHGESCGKKGMENKGTAPATAAQGGGEEIQMLKERLARLEAERDEAAKQPAESWS
jgi:hypothetical protein